LIVFQHPENAMQQTRREFTKSVIAAGVAAGAAMSIPGFLSTASADDARRQNTAAKKRKVLFLGGTGFIGPHIVQSLLRDGHEVTLFNRGNRDELFPDLEHITGNRIPSIEPGLEPLAKAVTDGRRWDTAIDTSNVHKWVRDSGAVLRDAVDQYVYTSSMSVYADNSIINQDEDGALAQMPDEVADSIDRLPYDMNYFGPVKARSELAAREVFGDRALIVRPGLIVGPRDWSHRFTYWPWRIRISGEVLAPGNPEDRVMFIDARDLADFLALNIAKGTGGTFNLNGPSHDPLTIGGMLDTCNEALDANASFTWVDAEFLSQRGVHAWAQMPVWIPPAEGRQGFHTRSIDRARNAGLKTRPLAETVRDTMAWFDQEFLPEAEKRGQHFLPGENAPGISLARERVILTEWKARQKQ